MRIGVLHGPNLNLLGSREPKLYGAMTLEEIDDALRHRAGQLEIELEFRQSNHEGELVDWIQQRAEDVAGWLVNAAGLTHTSVALRDALSASARPFVEVHLSNIFAREAFRRESLLSELAVGLVTGFRERSYLLALDGLVGHIRADR